MLVRWVGNASAGRLHDFFNFVCLFVFLSNVAEVSELTTFFFVMGNVDGYEINFKY